MAKRKNYVPIITLGLMSGMIACSGKRAADVAQTAAKIEHNPAQCPALDKIKGDFAQSESKDTIPKDISIQDDANSQHLIVTFGDNEQLVVDGNKQQQEDGANLSGACIVNSIHVVGTNSKNEFVAFRIKPSDDGKTLIVNLEHPGSGSVKYDRSAIPSLLNLSQKTKNYIDKMKYGKKESGLPTK